MTRPTISVQAAIGPGNTATNIFTIGTSLIGGTDLIGETPIAGQGSWQELGLRCTQLSTRSGRQRRLEQFRAATLVAEFDNTDGAMDPAYTAGPYTDGLGSTALLDEFGMPIIDEFGVPLYDTAGVGGTTRINPNVAVKVVATWAGVNYPLSYTYADSWKQIRSYPEGGVMELSATDAFKILQRINRMAGTPAFAGDLTGTRLNRLLDLIGWSTVLRDIDPGTFTHQATDFGGIIADQMRLAADSARGDLFISAAGKVTYRDWLVWFNSPRALTPQWTFGDGATEISTAGFEEIRDDQLIYNDVNANRVGGAVITRQDPSVAATPYLWSSYNRTDLTVENDDQVGLYADAVLRTSKDRRTRLDYIALEPDGVDSLWPVVLGARFSDRVTVNLVHPYTGVRFAGDYFIEGIDHDIPVVESGGKWVTKFYLSSAATYPTNPFIIGRSLIGGADLLV